jgi:hypothetical protein
MAKCSFWYQDSFHGIDLTSLKDDATKEIFTQPVVVSVWKFKKKLFGRLLSE